MQVAQDRRACVSIRRFALPSFSAYLFELRKRFLGIFSRGGESNS
jgi:hypothetical protein